MSRAGIEATSWKIVGQSGDEGLIGRFATTKPVTSDLCPLEVDLATHKSVGPKWVELQQMAEQFHRARFAGASQVNDASRGSGLPVELEVIREAVAAAGDDHHDGARGVAYRREQSALKRHSRQPGFRDGNAPRLFAATTH